EKTLPTKSKSSISKTNVAFGPILSPEPFSPYAYSDLHVKRHISPRFIVATPISHALITEPLPRSNSNFSFQSFKY
ncbi:unnamed protein product, partial [Rotaria sp. Silwood2]